MKKETILEEIHRYRAEYAKKFNYDIEAMGRDLMRRQKTSGWKLVKRSPKPVRDLPGTPQDRPRP